MISAKDLRLGNWILDRGIPTQVSMLSVGVTFYSINGVNLDKGTGLTLDDNKEDRFSAIELTIEILEDLGFKKHTEKIKNYDALYEDYRLGSFVFIHIDPFGKPAIREVEYDRINVEERTHICNHIFNLHQLQNLYHSLTGKELSYHPSTISEKTE